MKKIIFPLLTLSVTAFAQSSEPSSELAARNNNNYRMQDNSRSRDNTKDAMASKECRSYVYPLTWDKGNIFIEADYIYWKPVAKIPYAVTSDLVNFVDTAGTTFQISTNRTVNQVNLSAKSGFKVALGAYLPPYGWTTSGEYTYLKRTSSGSTTGVTDNTITNANATKNIDAVWRTLGLATGASDPERLTSAAASQKLSYQTFDWVMQKTVFWKSMFAFSPYFGVRGVWIKNKLDVTYDGIATTAPINLQDIARVQSDYRAGGLRAGFKGNWMLGYGLEIFGNASMSLVYGKHFIRQKEDVFALSSTSPANAFLNASTTSANDWKAVRSAFQLALGLEWGHSFNNDNVFFGLNIAYEANLWPNVVQLSKLQRQRSLVSSGHNLSDPITEPLQDLNRTLGLHGLTVGAKLDF